MIYTKIGSKSSHRIYDAATTALCLRLEVDIREVEVFVAYFIREIDVFVIKCRSRRGHVGRSSASSTLLARVSSSSEFAVAGQLGIGVFAVFVADEVISVERGRALVRRFRKSAAHSSSSRSSARPSPSRSLLAQVVPVFAAGQAGSSSFPVVCVPGVYAAFAGEVVESGDRRVLALFVEAECFVRGELLDAGFVHFGACGFAEFFADGDGKIGEYADRPATCT